MRLRLKLDIMYHYIIGWRKICKAIIYTDKKKNRECDIYYGVNLNGEVYSLPRKFRGKLKL
jgi:hypothetical protein